MSQHREQISIVDGSLTTPPLLDSDSNNIRRSRSPIRRRSGGSRHRDNSRAQSPIQPVTPTTSSTRRRNVEIDFSNLRYEWIEGKRFGSSFLHTIEEEQLYRKKIERQGIMHLVCYFGGGCNAAMNFDVRQKICFRKVNLKVSLQQQQHNHGSKKSEITKIQVASEMKEKCRNAPGIDVGGSTVGNVRNIFQNAVRR